MHRTGLVKRPTLLVIAALCGVVGATMLAGCEGVPRATVTADAPSPQAVETSAEAPSHSATSSPDSPAGLNADGSLLITATSVGVFTIDDTVADIGAATGTDYSKDLLEQGEECGSVIISETGLYAKIYALAASEGALGHIDTLGAYLPGGAPATTAEGIGMGSTEAEILAAYGEDIQHKPDVYQENFTEYWIPGTDDTAMTFTVDDTGVVEYWEVGRVEQLDYPEGCA